MKIKINKKIYNILNYYKKLKKIFIKEYIKLKLITKYIFINIEKKKS